MEIFLATVPGYSSLNLKFHMNFNLHGHSGNFESLVVVNNGVYLEDLLPLI